MRRLVGRTRGMLWTALFWLMSLGSALGVEALLANSGISWDLAHSGKGITTFASSSVSPTLEERALEARGLQALPAEPFTELTPARAQGVYFGVGFQQIGLNLRHGTSILANDSTSNGVAYNLGTLWNERIYEYSRHVALIDMGRTVEYRGEPFNFIEIVQNDFWFLFSPRVFKDVYLQYGMGLRPGTEIRLLLKSATNATAGPAEPNTNPPLLREDSLLFGLGGAYFVTNSFFVQYRFAQAQFSPLLAGPGVDVLVRSSQIHTFLLQYYFSL